MASENEMVNQLLGPASLIFFFIFIVIFMVVSWVLHYHWIHYGVSQEKISQVKLWYFSVSFVLLSIMAITFIFMLI